MDVELNCHQFSPTNKVLLICTGVLRLRWFGENLINMYSIEIYSK